MRRPSESIALKGLVGLVALLVLFAIVMNTIGYRVFTDSALDQYADGTFRTARMAESYVDPATVRDFARQGSTGEAYEATWRQLDALCNHSGSTFVYVIVPDTRDFGHITFVYSTINADSPYEHYEPGYVRETTNDEYRAKYRSLWEHKSTEELVVRNKGYIQTDPHITAMRALEDEDGSTVAIVCVQRQMDVLAEARATYFREVTAALVVFVTVVAIGQGFYLDRMLIRPVRRMAAEASRFAAESVPATQKLSASLKRSDELGTLASSIDHMEEAVDRYVNDLTVATAEKERIATELGLATRIQADMLPNIFPAFPERDEFDIYATTVPAREVGGDFYNYVLFDEDHLCMLIADVSGKGVPAALFMMASMILLSNLAQMGKSPAEIMASANETICANNREGMFVTVWLGVLEISSGRLVAANAGHEYPLVAAPGKDFELVHDNHSFVLGGMEGMPYEEYELTLEPGSRIFVYTDGIIEAIDGREQQFGTDRLLASVNASRDFDAAGVVDRVLTDVRAYVGDEEQFDDLTMLSLVFSGAGGGRSDLVTGGGTA